MHMQLLHTHSTTVMCTRSGSPHNVLHSSSRLSMYMTKALLQHFSWSLMRRLSCLIHCYEFGPELVDTSADSDCIHKLVQLALFLGGG